jgi:hypothetical protein
MLELEPQDAPAEIAGDALEKRRRRHDHPLLDRFLGVVVVIGANGAGQRTKDRQQDRCRPKTTERKMPEIAPLHASNPAVDELKPSLSRASARLKAVRPQDRPGMAAWLRYRRNDTGKPSP